MSARTKAVLYFGAGIFILGSVLVARMVLASATLDATLCPKGKAYAPSRHVVALVDPSDPLSPEQWGLVEAEIEQARSGLSRGDRLSLFVLADTPGKTPIKELFSRCHPGTRADASAIGENPEMVQKQYEEKFLAVLDRAIAELKKSPRAEWSPLIHAVHRIATLETFGPAIPNRTLIVVSDLLEHSSLASAYRGSLSIEALRGSVYLEQMKGRLAGVSVLVHQIKTGRPAEAPWPTVDAFWQEVFARGGVPRPVVRWM